MTVETKRPFGTGLVRLLAVLAFAFILFMPVSQGTLLVVAFGLMVIAAFLTFLNTKRVLTLPIAGVAAIALVLGTFGLLVGSANPGFANATVIFGWAPLLFFFCISALGQGSIKELLTTSAVMTIISGIYILVYVAGAQGVTPQLIPSTVLELTGAGYGEDGERSAVRFYGLSTLAAAGPMWLTSLFVGKDSMLPGTRLRIAAAASAVAGAAVGGRRAIVLTLLIIPIFAWIVKRSTREKRVAPRKIAPTYVIAGLVATTFGVILAPQIIAAPIVAITLQSTAEFFSGTSSTVAADASIRTYQAERLIDAWSESPIVGHGFGAIMNGYLRDGESPSRFELQYHSLLMQTGIIGALLILLIAAIVWTSMLRAASLRPDLLPSLTVTVCAGAAMLIANASNPYLQAPAHMWAIFLPLAVINMMLRDPAPNEDLAALPSTVITGSQRYLKA